MTTDKQDRARPSTIFRIGAGDGDRLRAIRLRALRDSPDAFGSTWEEVAAGPPESWERQIGQLPTFVAVDDGQDIGLVRGAPDDESCDFGYLISMWVAPEGRRRGVGSALIDAVVRWARIRGWERLLLDVGEKNAPAIALYTAKGFVPNGVLGTLPAPRDHVREIQMVLRLSPVCETAD